MKALCSVYDQGIPRPSPSFPSLAIQYYKWQVQEAEQGSVSEARSTLFSASKSSQIMF